ncbi:LysM peptidoglycan-binding domain-containing protein [Streptomyces sp. NBC_01456]|uniref:LysM peptidoglycan-binding domain-containing protein n=1 Tax=unclassified Streptomyces TaxID=2593676 RepID=UPI002E3187B0|nr:MULTISPECIES: LysM domain-containing protein [unclassified Streptomyces]
MFEPGSRYHGIATTVHTNPDGRRVSHLRRRFLPQPEELATVGVHVVAAGDRLDRIAARHYGDPEQYWRIADANRALWPGTLTAVPGRRLRLTLPAGVPGGRASDGAGRP